MPSLSSSLNPDSRPKPIAYFCAEYGLTASLPFYAGGLGVLAGDTLKAAAEAKTPVVAIGLMYRGIDQVQHIDSHGRQVEQDFEFDPVTQGLEHVYLEELPLFIQVHLTHNQEVWVRCWKKTISDQVVLYLLDTDTDQNEPRERSITHALYHGSEETQLLQQIILGLAGVKLLERLDIQPSVYHLNEGRPAFVHWQLIRHFMELHGLQFDEARQESVRRTVYTNHTLVGAGNPGVSADLLRVYAQYQADKMGVTVDRLLEMGTESSPDYFSTTIFALNVSRKANGVSQLHTQLSAENWPNHHWVNVTNGVHLKTWQDDQVRQSVQHQDDSALWQRHQQLKHQTMEFIKARTGFEYDPNRLVVTWARRITGYKQLESLFADIEQLRDILRGQEGLGPVQLLLAGKAHPGDVVAKDMLQRVIKILSRELAGYGLFVPNYDLEVARHLTAGSDVWLNTPELGKEASGTSGMKAISNGVLQCTVADGWAAEVDWSQLGWVLDPERISHSLYHFLGGEISQLYYDRNHAGLPLEWLRRMRRSVELAENYSAARMWREYLDVLYK